MDSNPKFKTVKLVKECKRCADNPTHSQITWIAIIGLALLLEAAGLRRQRNAHTLSHSTRYVFRTETKPGAAVFTIAWAALTVWFIPHVLKGGVKK